MADILKPEVIVVQTGVANTASVLAGLRRAGGEPRLSNNPEDVRTATHVVLPGVGAFGAAMEMLREYRIVQPLRERIQADQRTLCICLGLQLLCAESEESPGVAGLGIINCVVKKFSGTLKVPQLGWNEVKAGPGCKILTTGFGYFANSYRLPAGIADWNVAHTNYGGEFVSAIERGAVVGCQFHPELSSTWGLGILRRWLGGGK